MTTALGTVALGLALVGAVCFAFSAVHQHSAVADHLAATASADHLAATASADHLAATASADHLAATASADHAAGAALPDRAIGLSSLRRLVRRPRWLLGMALAAAGGLLAMVALSLAPLAVIQPIGVLSVPFALLIHAVQRNRRPRRVELVAVLAAVLGTATFVWFVTGTAHSRAPEAVPVLAAGMGTGAVVAMLALLGRFGPYHRQAICWSAAGAGLYGLGTTMIKSIFLLGQAQPGTAVLGEPTVWVAGAVAVTSFPVGVWAVQHAYLAGTPQAVVATLTVVDPLVCVALGFGLLGEGGASPVELVGMALSAAVALLAVLQLARADTLAAAPPTPPTSPTPPAPHRVRALLTTGRHA